jgi:hypothetical protein
VKAPADSKRAPKHLLGGATGEQAGVLGDVGIAEHLAPGFQCPYHSHDGAEDAWHLGVLVDERQGVWDVVICTPNNVQKAQGSVLTKGTT